MLVIYYGFIALVAFAPSAIAVKLFGSITVGLVAGRRDHPRGDRSDRHLCPARERAIRRPDQGDRQRQRRGRQTMNRLVKSSALAAAFALAAGAARAADAGAAPPIDWNALIIFGAFVVLTLGITYWAAKRTRTAKDFYAAGGGITGLQNGLAIAGDYMSAASFLGISALVLQLRLLRPDLFDRLPRRLADHHVPDGRAAAQPRPLHLRRRRLVSTAGNADPRDGSHRHLGDRGLLPDRADGRRRTIDRDAVRPALPLRGRLRRRDDDHLRHLRRHDRHHLGADHQGRPAAPRRDADVAAGACAIRLRLQCAGRQGDRSPSQS